MIGQYRDKGLLQPSKFVKFNRPHWERPQTDWQLGNVNRRVLCAGAGPRTTGGANQAGQDPFVRGFDIVLVERAPVLVIGTDAEDMQADQLQI
jgi:hypothetical protein